MKKIWKLSLLGGPSPPEHLVNLGQWLLLNTLLLSSGGLLGMLWVYSEGKQ